MKKCVIGFDGYQDILCRPVKKYQGNMPVFWRSMSDFAEYIKSGRNVDIQLVQSCSKYGGNGPILSGALASLGMKTICVGMFDGCEDVLQTLKDRVECYSLGQCNQCTALEFDDGKIMLGKLESMELCWETFKKKMPEKKLRKIMEGCSLLGIVNWSAFLNMNSIIEQLEKNIFPEWNGQYIFLDLADFSAREQEDIRGLIKMIKRLALKYRIILGLNEKELELLGEKYYEEKTSKDMVGMRVAKEIPESMIIVHGREGAVCYQRNGRTEAQSSRIENPVCLTGAGDHFNAGICYGILKGMEIREVLNWGNRTAYYYILHGRDLTLEK
ncbi:MAG: carbohydrate kinase family protein [Eubacteriales bacterium]|nr:carbohydrate kinase family protein [Eubacteriales bacterium]